MSADLRALADRVELYTANPSDNGESWFVWDMYDPPPKPVFFGTMEEAGGVADALNAALRARALLTKEKG